MKWSGRRSSENFEDRRGMSSGGKTIVGVCCTHFSDRNLKDLR
ncbi:hypothetical protein [Flavobacterium sp. GSP14]